MTMQGDLALKHANGLSFADVLALHAHLLAEQIRSAIDANALDLEGGGGASDAADLIDPRDPRSLDG